MESGLGLLRHHEVLELGKAARLVFVDLNDFFVFGVAVPPATDLLVRGYVVLD